MKVRVILNGVCFYTNGTQIKRGIGAFDSQNIAVRQVYERMLQEKTEGLGTTIHLYDNKMQKQSFQVQLNRV